MEGSEVQHHAYPSPVQPGMCNDWLLKLIHNMNVIITQEACCETQGPLESCYLSCLVSTDSEITGLSVQNTTRRHLVGWKNSVAMQDREVYYLQQFFIQTRVANTPINAKPHPPPPPPVRGRWG